MNAIANAISYLPLFLIKHWNDQKTFLHLSMPAIGLIHAVHKRSLASGLIPLMILFILCGLQGLILQETTTVVRSCQGILMVFFADWISLYLEERRILRLTKSVLILSLLYYALEKILISSLPGKMFLPGVYLTRFSGIVGESNFSALALFGFAAMAFQLRKYWLYFFYFLAIIPLMSRMGLILVLLIPLAKFVTKLPEKYLRITIFAIISFVLLVPWITGGLDAFLPDSYKLQLSHLTNGRFGISVGYWNIFKNNFMGVGFYNGPNSILQNIPSFYHLNHYPYQQHSLYMQSLSEMGIWGWGLFSFFILKTTNRILNKNIDFAWSWTLLLIGLMALNGYSEFILYFFISQAILGDTRLNFFGRQTNPS
jgi:hypothetical protein